MISLLLFSCEKEPGEGGMAVITGNVLTREYSDAGNFIGEYYTAEQRVYIVYGAGSTPDDDMRSGFDGSYRFEYLRKGDYTVYAISECNTCVSNQRVVAHEVTITKRNQVVELPDLIIDNY